MREIRFRGKRVDNGEWTHGSYIDASAMLCGHIIVDVYGVHRHVHPETVGQYSGLNDKNGNEIYEGDVVRVKVTQNCDVRLYGNTIKEGVVQYDDEYPQFTLKGNFMNFVNWAYNDELEIIGNIHEVKE